MYDWQNFDVVFQGKPDYSYDEKTVHNILKNRKELAGALYFDRVWSNLGLRDRKFVNIYEPDEETAREHFFKDISRFHGLNSRLTYISRQVIPSSNES
jgi:hypothetical protein